MASRTKGRNAPVVAVHRVRQVLVDEALSARRAEQVRVDTLVREHGEQQAVLADAVTMGRGAGTVRGLVDVTTMLGLNLWLHEKQVAVEAIEQQLSSAERDLSERQEALRGRMIERSAIEKLQDRIQTEEIRQDARRVQKVVDEWASIAVAREMSTLVRGKVHGR